MNRRLLLAGAVMTAACYPTTTRPPFVALPTAATTQIELPIDRATTALALALDGDSIPVTRTETKDGWLETGWFDASTLRPTRTRALGDSIVKIRAFIDPTRPNFSSLTVETVYRPLANPARSDRDLERQVEPEHPVAKRVRAVLDSMVRQFGGVPDSVPLLGKSTVKTNITDSLNSPAVRRRLNAQRDSLQRGAPPDSTVQPVPVPALPQVPDSTVPKKKP